MQANKLHRHFLHIKTFSHFSFLLLMGRMGEKRRFLELKAIKLVMDYVILTGLMLGAKGRTVIKKFCFRTVQRY